MKKYEIRKEGEGSNTFTVYTNPDRELKSQIAEFQDDSKTVTMGWPPEEWTVEEKDNDEYRCTSGRNVKYFPIEDVEEAIKDRIESRRNTAFPAYKHFKKCFGEISHFQSDENGGSLTIIDLNEGANLGSLLGISGDVDPTSVSCYDHFYEYKISTYHCISLEAEVSGRMMCLYFTPEGDFINRDYNENLSLFENTVYSPTLILEKMKNMMLKSAGNQLERSGQKFYSKDKCFIPFNYGKDPDSRSQEFGVIVVPSIGNDKYQISRGDTIYKKPKNLSPCTFEDMWNSIMESLTPLQKCLISDDYKNWKQHVPIREEEKSL